MGTRVPSCGEICKCSIRYFVPIMEMNLKIKVFMKLVTDDEINEKKCDYFFRPFSIKQFLGVNLGKFQDIWIFLKAVLNFS